jgi:hypothetical protein
MPKFELTNVSWRIHHVTLSDLERIRQLYFINEGQTVMMAFRN